MYRRILVPLDGSPLSETALEHLRHVAGDETDVLLLRVLEAGAARVPAATTPEVPPVPVPAVLPGRAAAAATEEATAKAILDAEEHLQAKAASIHGHVHKARAMVLQDDDAAAAISAAARDEGADLIVMASHGRSGVARWVLGSVAERVLRATDCPILLIRPGRPAE